MVSNFPGQLLCQPDSPILIALGAAAKQDPGPQSTRISLTPSPSGFQSPSSPVSTRRTRIAMRFCPSRSRSASSQASNCSVLSTRYIVGYIRQKEEVVKGDD
jgi:hypothetical protein